MDWKPVGQWLPACHRVVLLYRVGDLYPVVGFRVDETYWLLEEGGAEDGEHRTYPRPGGGEEWQPTHYAGIDTERLWLLSAPEPQPEPEED